MQESGDVQKSDNTSVQPENPIVTLVELMQKVEVDTSESKLNAASISDGKGGRIRL